MSLKNVLEEINAQKAIANADIEVDSATYRVKLGKKKRAKEELTRLFEKYRQEVNNKGAFILVHGESRDKFIEIAEKEFGCFKQDAEEFYYDITSDVDKRLYTNYTCSSNIFNIVAAKFEEKALDIGIIGYLGLLFDSKYKKTLNSKEDLVNIIKRAFNEKVGAESVALDMVDKVAKVALENEFSGKAVPIIVGSEDEILIRDFMKDFPKVSNSVILITAGKSELKKESFKSITKVTEESVEKTLTEIRKKL